MKKALMSICFIALAVALPASAQMQPKVVAEITVVKARPGMHSQWAEGRKKVNQWLHQHNYPFPVYCWSIISGPRDGQFVTGTLGHAWKDFRTEAVAGREGLWREFATELAPNTESHVTSYWVYRKDLSGHPENAGQAPPRFSEVTTFFLKQGGRPAVTDVIKAINAAIEKSHWPGEPADWYALVNGGYGNQLALVVPRKNWADFQPPEPAFPKMLTGVYGQQGAGALFRKFNSGVRSELNEIWVYRPALSYIPAKQ